MRDLYKRHKTDCKLATKPNGRKLFKCDCPFYARFDVVEPATNETLFDFNGSLTKLGITAEDMAEKQFNSWTLQYLSGEKKPAHQQRASLTVAEAVHEYLTVIAATKGMKYDAALPYTHVDVIKRNRSVLGGLPAFCEAQGITHLEQVQAAHLSAFQLTWPG